MDALSGPGAPASGRASPTRICLRNCATSKLLEGTDAARTGAAIG